VTRLRSTSSAALAVAVLASAALGLSACSSSSVSGNAIVVNGTALSNKDFEARLQAIQGNEAYTKRAFTDQSGKTLVLGDNPGNYSTDFTTQVLNQQVSFVLAQQEVARRGLTVSDDDRAHAQSLLASDLTTAPATSASAAPADDGSGLKTLDDLGPFKTTLVEGVSNILAIQTAITADLSTDEALRTAFDAGGDTYKNQACVSGLLLVAGQGPTQDPTTGATVPPPDSDYGPALTRANDLAAKLKAGSDVATLDASSDNSKIGVTKGDLGCTPLGTYAKKLPELDAAISAQPIGVAGVPIKTSYGYFVIVVRSRGDLTFDEAKSQLQAGVKTAMRTAFQDWITQAAKDADVTVDPQWGSWDKGQGTVIPPAGSTSTSTTADPSAAGSSLTPEQLQQLTGGAGNSGGAAGNSGAATDPAASASTTTP
jgi:hypothetical protein